MQLFRVDDRPREANDRTGPRGGDLVELSSVDEAGEFDNKLRLLVSADIFRRMPPRQNVTTGPGSYFRVDIQPVAKKVTFEGESAIRRGD